MGSEEKGGGRKVVHIIFLMFELQETRTSTMVEYGIPNGATAMSRTVGIPCAIAVQLILDGSWMERERERARERERDEGER